MRILMLLSGFVSTANEFEKDVFKTSKGDLVITFIGHGTLMMEFDDKVIHIDPVSWYASYDSLPKADLILITHEHGDHLDVKAIDAIKKQSTEIVLTKICSKKYTGASILKNGDSGKFADLKIEAVPAYNVKHFCTPYSNNKNMHRIALAISILFVFYSIGFAQEIPGKQVFSGYKEMVASAKNEIEQITVADFYMLYSKALKTGNSNFTLIDIRTSDESAAGFIPGAFLVQRGTLESKLEKDEFWAEFNRPKPEKSEAIILYCRSGSRSALAAKTLMQLGYTNVKSLAEGWKVWSVKYPNLVKIDL